jgi:serine/threonine protein phosphatase PrpC
MLKEKSGSCACAVMIVDDIVYVANVGDSRAVLSM